MYGDDEEGELLGELSLPAGARAGGGGGVGDAGGSMWEDVERQARSRGRGGSGATLLTPEDMAGMLSMQAPAANAGAGGGEDVDMSGFDDDDDDDNSGGGGGSDGGDGEKSGAAQTKPRAQQEGVEDDEEDDDDLSWAEVGDGRGDADGGGDSESGLQDLGSGALLSLPPGTSVRPAQPHGNKCGSTGLRHIPHPSVAASSAGQVAGTGHQAQGLHTQQQMQRGGDGGGSGGGPVLITPDMLGTVPTSVPTWRTTSDDQEEDANDGFGELDLSGFDDDESNDAAANDGTSDQTQQQPQPQLHGQHLAGEQKGSHERKEDGKAVSPAPASKKLQGDEEEEEEEEEDWDADLDLDEGVAGVHRIQLPSTGAPQQQQQQQQQRQQQPQTFLSQEPPQGQTGGSSITAGGSGGMATIPFPGSLPGGGISAGGGALSQKGTVAADADNANVPDPGDDGDWGDDFADDDADWDAKLLRGGPSDKAGGRGARPSAASAGVGASQHAQSKMRFDPLRQCWVGDDVDMDGFESSDQEGDQKGGTDATAKDGADRRLHDPEDNFDADFDVESRTVQQKGAKVALSGSALEIHEMLKTLAEGPGAAGVLPTGPKAGAGMGIAGANPGATNSRGPALLRPEDVDPDVLVQMMRSAVERGAKPGSARSGRQGSGRRADNGRVGAGAGGVKSALEEWANQEGDDEDGLELDPNNGCGDQLRPPGRVGAKNDPNAAALRGVKSQQRHQHVVDKNNRMVDPPGRMTAPASASSQHGTTWDADFEGGLDLSKVPQDMQRASTGGSGGGLRLVRPDEMDASLAREQQGSMRFDKRTLTWVETDDGADVNYAVGADNEIRLGRQPQSRQQPMDGEDVLSPTGGRAPKRDRDQPSESDPFDVSEDMTLALLRAEQAHNTAMRAFLSEGFFRRMIVQGSKKLAQRSPLEGNTQEATVQRSLSGDYGAVAAQAGRADAGSGPLSHAVGVRRHPAAPLQPGGTGTSNESVHVPRVRIQLPATGGSSGTQTAAGGMAGSAQQPDSGTGTRRSSVTSIASIEGTSGPTSRRSSASDLSEISVAFGRTYHDADNNDGSGRKRSSVRRRGARPVVASHNVLHDDGKTSSGGRGGAPAPGHRRGTHASSGGSGGSSGSVSSRGGGSRGDSRGRGARQRGGSGGGGGGGGGGQHRGREEDGDYLHTGQDRLQSAKMSEHRFTVLAETWEFVRDQADATLMPGGTFPMPHAPRDANASSAANDMAQSRGSLSAMPSSSTVSPSSSLSGGRRTGTLDGRGSGRGGDRGATGVTDRPGRPNRRVRARGNHNTATGPLSRRSMS